MYRLDEPTPSASEDAPRCWVSFKDGERAGGCSAGQLVVEEIGSSNGLVPGWNGAVSYMSVPPGWTVYAFHQMWALGPEENVRRQGFVVHEADGEATEVRLSAGEFPILRDPTGHNWDYCRTWHPEAFVGPPAQETVVNDNLQCLYINPDEISVDDALILAESDPPASAQLKITYEP